MNTVWVRLNAVVFFGLTVLLGLALMTATSTYLHEGHPTVKTLRLNKIKSFRSQSKVDRAIINFDLEADLAPAFNWNIKQIFVFVVAEFATKTNPLNQIILWDKIIEKPEDARLNLKKMHVKYGLIDQREELKGTDVTLHLYWDHMPLTGRLYTHSVAEDTFTLPMEYIRPGQQV
ncbi:signal peptidase 22kDa subunit [Tribonema minus]|uniref:Signal peptidase complex subunit 3 n=1 Tax=Tribonema minus TaxID=303371 RepID=A0A835YJ42_9STRA|nr:signal peptidase 22kDa subunit [Tribonema minus]